jgi:hypothetical protein
MAHDRAAQAGGHADPRDDDDGDWEGEEYGPSALRDALAACRTDLAACRTDLAEARGDLERDEAIFEGMQLQLQVIKTQSLKPMTRAQAYTRTSPWVEASCLSRVARPPCF